MKRTIILLVLVLAAGCAPCRKCPYKNLVQKDSVYVKETVHETRVDTVIQWKVPEGQSSAVIPDTDTSRLHTSLAESEAWVKDGQLHHNIRNRADLTLPIALTIPMKATEKEHGLIRERTVTVEVEKQLTRWQRLSLTIGQWTIGILAILLMTGLIALIHKLKTVNR